MESNKFTEEKSSDWQRLESVIEWANMTTNYFARNIGLARSERLYQIKRGNNGISRKLAAMIVEKFPEISLVWLTTGCGEMFAQSDDRSGAKPLFNVGVEENIRTVDSLTPDSQLLLPQNLDFDFGMLYLGRAMGESTPANTVLLLKKILLEMIIPGDECVIVTEKIVLLRIVKIEIEDNGHTRLRLTATNNQNFGDLLVAIEQVEAVYKVKGKVLINN